MAQKTGVASASGKRKLSNLRAQEVSSEDTERLSSSRDESPQLAEPSTSMSEETSGCPAKRSQRSGQSCKKTRKASELNTRRPRPKSSSLRPSEAHCYFQPSSSRKTPLMLHAQELQALLQTTMFDAVNIICAQKIESKSRGAANMSTGVISVPELAQTPEEHKAHHCLPATPAKHATTHKGLRFGSSVCSLHSSWCFLEKYNNFSLLDAAPQR